MIDLSIAVPIKPHWMYHEIWDACADVDYDLRWCEGLLEMVAEPIEGDVDDVQNVP
jgi:hypothetical protein